MARAEYYFGVDGASFNVEDENDLMQAIDILHTQIMDNIAPDSHLLEVLESAMKTLAEDFNAELD